VTDPTGPTSNPLGFKVMRGGAYDYPNSSCRSASRLFQDHADTNLGFRVVLVIEPTLENSAVLMDSSAHVGSR
jgi:formylglycine-generating enzyme required for sulfatase activity